MLGDDYATLSQIKERLNITDTTDDSALESALTSASRGIEAFCDRQFNTDNTATDRRFRPVTPAVAHVADFHTTTDLVVATDNDGDGTFETTWSAGDYELEPLNQYQHGETWPIARIRAVGSRAFPVSQRASLQVTAQWGWASVPAPVVEACLIMAAETFKMRDAPFGVAGFGEFGVVRVRANPKAAALLEPYQRTKARVG